MEGISGQNVLTSIDFPRKEYFQARENANELFMQFKDAIFSVWENAASGKATSPPAVEKTDKKEPKKNYFGSQ
jgi:hypothetical protein